MFWQEKELRSMKEPTIVEKVVQNLGLIWTNAGKGKKNVGIKLVPLGLAWI